MGTGLVSKGHQVTVYNSHHHPYKQNKWNGVQIIHCYDGEQSIGTAGQFIYDLNCIWNARKKKFDIILFLGYTSSSVWGRLFPGSTTIISNMDGMEWKRSKYSGPVKRFLMFAEKLAVKYSHHLIADSPVVKQYLDEKYKIQSTFIPYGAEISEIKDEAILKEYELAKNGYYMLMARMEPENNIDMILDGFCKSPAPEKFIVTGNVNNRFGKKMVEKFGKDERIVFTGGIFNQDGINTMRKYCKLYFHGHSVGGTNPSLLEAMSSGALIAAHNNDFNKAILKDDAFYFNTSDEVMDIISSGGQQAKTGSMICNNLRKIREVFNWPAIVDAYEAMMIECYKSKR